MTSLQNHHDGKITHERAHQLASTLREDWSEEDRRHYDQCDECRSLVEFFERAIDEPVFGIGVPPEIFAEPSDANLSVRKRLTDFGIGAIPTAIFYFAGLLYAQRTAREDTLGMLDQVRALQHDHLYVLIAVGLITTGIGVILQMFKVVARMPVFLMAVVGLLTLAFIVSQSTIQSKERRVSRKIDNLFRDRTFVGYDPTTIDVFTIPKQACDPVECEKELRELRKYFDALYTFGSDLNQDKLAEIAMGRLKYKAFIMGIFINGNPDEDKEQVRLAIDASEHVTAYCVGHNADVELKELAQWIAKVRRETKLPVGTTYPPLRYVGPRGESLREMGDFYFPDVLPRSLRTDPAVDSAITSLQASINMLADLRPDKPILLKMIGYPSGPDSDGFSEENQAEFFRRIRRGDVTIPERTQITYFSAFDSPGKMSQPSTEWANTAGHLGLFKADGKPKLAIGQVFRPDEFKVDSAQGLSP